jgi:ribosomal protein S5
MHKVALKIVAVAVFVSGSMVGLGVVHKHSTRPVLECCGLPGPICPGSPGCPVTLADKK